MIYLVISSLIWSFSFGIIKSQLTGLNPFLVSLIRLLLSFVVFLPFFRKTSGTMALKLTLIGAVQFGVMYCLYIYSYQFLKAYQVAVLTITTPLFIVLMDALLERRWRPHFWIAAFLTIIAALLIVADHGAFKPALKGVLLLQGANLCFAAGQLGYKKAISEQSAPAHFVWLYLGAFLVPLAMTLKQGVGFESLPSEASQWLSLLYLGLIPSGLCFFLWNTGVTKVNSGTVATLNNLKIPLGAFFSWAVFGESLVLLPLLLSFSLFAIALVLTKK